MLERRFIGVDELSRYLGVKKSTLYSWVNQRKIPYVKMGGLVKFDLPKIDEWLKKREVKPFKYDREF